MVDDDMNILTSFAMALEAEGFEIETYSDGQAAQDGFDKRIPEIGVFDIKMPRMDASKPVHATCIAVDGKALLILGQSGAGKSALGLSLMAMGATLVADDRVILTAHDGAVLASCPVPIRGLIEARGVGLLRAPHVEDVPVTLVVDMDRLEVERLPQRHRITVVDQSLPLLRRVDGLHFASALFQLMRYGRSEP